MGGDWGLLGLEGNLGRVVSFSPDGRPKFVLHALQKVLTWEHGKHAAFALRLLDPPN